MNVRSPGSDPTRPILSIIVPVRNEEKFIGDCLASILDDEPPGGLEVIVVDGMSDDRTADIAADLAVTRKNLRVLRNSTHFVPHAMNQGIEASRAPFVGRIDGHCLVLPGYFAGCLSRHRAGRFDCVGGVMVHEGVTDTGRAIAAASSSPVGVGSARFRTAHGGELLVDTVQYGVYRREVFERIGNFDEEFIRNQDDELNLRVTRGGGAILLVTDLRIRYYVRESLRKLARQYHQYGYWKWRVFRKHGTFASWRRIAPSSLLLLLGVLATSAPFFRLTRAVLVTTTGVYLLVIAGEALRLAWTRGCSWTRCALALMTMHVAYGAGLLRAVCDWVLGRKLGNRLTALSR